MVCVAGQRETKTKLVSTQIKSHFITLSKYKYFVCFFFYGFLARRGARKRIYGIHVYNIIIVYTGDRARYTHTHTHTRSRILLLLLWYIICFYACTDVLLCRCLVRVCVCLRCVIGQCPSNIVVVVVLRSSILLL